MDLSRPRLDARLREIEAEVPRLLEDRSGFPRAFEDLVEILLGQGPKEDQEYAFEQLEQIVARSGFNR